MIYEPREDSFLLQKFVKQFAKGKVLDLGTGSGIQALTALESTPDVLAADINPEAVSHAQKQGIQAVKSDLFSNIEETFDIIIFNPPYLPDVDVEDPESRLITTGGPKGHELLERFLKEAKQHLKKDGKILIVVSSLTGDIPKLVKEQEYTCEKLGEEKVPFETLIVYLIKP